MIYKLIIPTQQPCTVEETNDLYLAMKVNELVAAVNKLQKKVNKFTEDKHE